MNNEHGDIEGILTNFETGGMSRRRFLERMTALGVSTAVANAVLLSPLGVRKAFAAIGGPEERAWALAKDAAAKATKKTPDGTDSDRLDRQHDALRRQVEERTWHPARLH